MRYEIDDKDLITHVDNEWHGFADDNGAGQIDASTVLGTPIWQYFSGEEVRQLYQQIFERVRSQQTPASIPFRCDSADKRRFLRLTVEALPQSGLRLTVVTEFQETRTAVPLLDSNVGRNSDFLSICGWCKKVRLPDQTWVEVEEAVNTLRLFDAPLPRLSHGICVRCTDQFHQELQINSSVE